MCVFLSSRLVVSLNDGQPSNGRLKKVGFSSFLWHLLRISSGTQMSFFLPEKSESLGSFMFWHFSGVEAEMLTGQKFLKKVPVDFKIYTHYSGCWPLALTWRMGS